MSKIEKYTPNKKELFEASKAHQITLVGFRRELERLEQTDFLPRHNRLRVRIKRLKEFSFDILFLTVRRHGSKLGEDNFYSEPIFVDGLCIGETAEYDILSFDSFAVPFDSISIEMCTLQDFQKRKVSIGPKNIERRRKLTTRITG